MAAVATEVARGIAVLVRVTEVRRRPPAISTMQRSGIQPLHATIVFALGQEEPGIELLASRGQARHRRRIERSLEVLACCRQI